MIKKYSDLQRTPMFSRKLKWLNDEVIDIPFYTVTPEPQHTAEERVVTSQIFNKKGKKDITCYRVSLMEKEGNLYIQVERGEEVRGSFDGVEVRFVKMTDSDIESDRVASKLAKDFWDKNQA